MSDVVDDRRHCIAHLVIFLEPRPHLLEFSYFEQTGGEGVVQDRVVPDLGEENANGLNGVALGDAVGLNGREWQGCGSGGRVTGHQQGGRDGNRPTHCGFGGSCGPEVAGGCGR